MFGVVFRIFLSSGASRGSLYGVASLKVEKSHFLQYEKKGPKNRKNEVKLHPPRRRHLKHSMILRVFGTIFSNLWLRKCYDQSCHLQEARGSLGPKSPKRLKKVFSGLPARNIKEVSRKSSRTQETQNHGEIFGEKTLVKPNLIFGEKPPKTISLANSTVLRTRHRHSPRTLPSLRSAQRKQAEVKGLSVLALCRLERQARGTKRATKVGVLCSLCRHVSLVGLSLLNCIRWRLGLGPSNSRLQREHSVVARLSKGGGDYALNDFGGARISRVKPPSNGNSRWEM